MRLLAVGMVAFLVLIVVLAVLFHRDRTARAWRVAEGTAMWEAGHYSKGSATHVVVRKIARLASGETRELETIKVTTIYSVDPDWQGKFAAAKQVAIDRAFEMNCSV
jgi:hypothetical protein